MIRAGPGRAAAPRYNPAMAATSPLDVPEPATVATAVPPREPLLDPFVCGIREIEEPPAAPGTSPASAATAAPEDPPPTAAPPAR